MTDNRSTIKTLGGWSTDLNRPDYACPAYREMEPRWVLVDDLRAATERIREKKSDYLPKFESESQKDWDSRVKMTFVEDHYGATLTEHVGLVFAESLKLGDDVPEPIKELAEDIDGEGNHLDVFAQDALDSALHFGHIILFTDYPVADNIRTLKDEKEAGVRPYVTMYRAPDILCPRFETVGGVKVLVQVTFRETTSEASGAFGVKDCIRYREVKQEVFYDMITDRATGLGKITYTVREATDTTDSQGNPEFRVVGQGEIKGPKKISARIVYGGQKLGPLHTKPHLIGLAYSNLEETQVKSDYANIMHKCNVPTYVFIGRNPSGDGNEKVVMGEGLDIPQGGDAKVLEPSGAAIGATRQRLEDIKGQMRRQGATMGDDGGKVMTWGEARLYAAQRNAKLRRAARSLQDALEGVLADMAAFMGIEQGGKVKSGGSVIVNQEFAGQGLDPAYLTVLLNAYNSGAIELPDLLYALKNGRLPEDMDAEESAFRLMAEKQADADAEAEEAKRLEDEKLKAAA